MMGINRKDGKATMETIPSLPDRSAFSCERYQFFLDAPFEISNQCCRISKKDPLKQYTKETGRHPITAQMASESRLRTQIWLKQGCNAFDSTKPISNPMSPWTEDDVLLYIRNLEKEMIEWRNEEFKKKYGCYPEESEFPFSITSPIASVYGEVLTDDEESKQMSLADFMDFELFDLGAPCLHTTGCSRTGCITCLYGYHHETTKEKSRIQNIIDFSNPKMADWMLRGGHFRESDGLWEPYQGLGYWFIMEWCNKWGNMKYWYPNREYYIEKYSTPETRKWLE